MACANPQEKAVDCGGFGARKKKKKKDTAQATIDQSNKAFKKRRKKLNLLSPPLLHFP